MYTGTVGSPSILTDVCGTKFWHYLSFHMGTNLCLSFVGTNGVKMFEDSFEKGLQCVRMWTGLLWVSLETSARSFL
jgi:hypothetical protein